MKHVGHAFDLIRVVLESRVGFVLVQPVAPTTPAIRDPRGLGNLVKLCRAGEHGNLPRLKSAKHSNTLQ